MTFQRLPGYALWRLLERPASLFLVLGIVAAVILPWANVPDPILPWANPSYNLARRTTFEYGVWRSCILLPFVSGVLLGLLTREALQTGLSWMLPRYRTRLMPPTIL